MPPNTNWHDVNDPGFFKKGEGDDPNAATATQEEVQQPAKKEPEVRLKKAYWKEGADGYEFTKECVVVVEGEYLVKTSRKRVTGNLYVIYNGEEEDLKHEASGFLEDNGTAELKVKLFYGKKYFDALAAEPDAKCEYILKKIRHSRGEKEIESEKLEMPKNTRISVDFLEIADVHFHHNCALPCLDENGDIITALVSAFSYAKDHADRDLVVHGHADRSGDANYNLQVSKRRAEAIKALLANDAELWSGVVKSDGTDQKIETEDYQQTLKSLSAKYGWPCDPGAVDNKKGPKTEAAVKGFQSEYNTRFPSNEQLLVDGVIGPKTWKAIFYALRSLLGEALKSVKLDPPPTLTYGYPDGDGIYPCGESSPVTDLEISEEDRRVELVFYAKGDWSPGIAPVADKKKDAKKDPVSEKDWEKTPLVSGSTATGKAPQVKIDTLDKWFIPGPTDKGGENCTIKYSLEGDASQVDKLILDVYASNYCEAEVSAKGEYKFTPIKEAIPVYSVDLSADKAQPGESYEIADWNGKVSATKGALKLPASGEKFINVAFSPYTVHFRYHKDTADAKARIDLDAFWPQFKDGSPVADSLKVRWTPSGCSRLKKGTLVIVDCSDAEVYKKELAEADLTENAHEVAWDGSLTNGGKVEEGKMPYRVRLSMNTAAEDLNGVAITAMHTEVRLFVDPKTGEGAQPNEDPNMLKFSLASHAPKAPDENTEETKWCQYKLAEAGFHPGPVDGVAGERTALALREFQRSFPKNAAKPFTRLTVTGTLDADTKAALKRATAGMRPLLGKHTDSTDLSTLTDLSTEDASKLLENKDESAIVWIEDRHIYTKTGADPFFMKDYHGAMDIGDGRVGKDTVSVARPAIPIQVAVPLLSRSTADKGLAADAGTVNEASHKAVGPIRVDFTFKETEPDFSVIDIDHANYKKHKTLIRSFRWMKEVTDTLSKTEGGTKFTNMPEKIGGASAGGLRPDDLAAYYKAVFGFSGSSLPPWHAEDSSATKSVATRVHDSSGQSADNFFAACEGKAGIYFSPSRASGDGYQCRAQVRFDEEPAGLGKFPNMKVLANRYPKAPQAHTCKLRTWRKASYRGYACWAPAAEKHWPAQIAGCTAFYRGAHLNFIHEGANPSSPTELAVNALVTAAEYSASIQTSVTDPTYSGLAITLDIECVWPYSTEKRLGIPQGQPGTTIANFYDQVFDPMFDETWRKFREGLLHLLMQKVEANEGLLRGFFLVEFRSSAKVDLQEYECSVCHATRAEATNNCTPVDLLTGTACPTCGTGVMNPTATSAYDDGIPLPAVGVAMGGTWLFTSGGSDVWAHEIGHIRHLQHSRSQPGSANMAPGGQVDQHDTAVNADPGLAGEPAKDSCWDRCCIMSYNQVESLFFCGKCLMKNRGIAVEKIANPAGNLHD